MTEGDDDQHAPERDERVARAQAEEDERTTDEFDELNGDANSPKRPDWRARADRVEIFSLRRP